MGAGHETTGHSERKRACHLERLALRELLALQLLGAHSLQLGVELRGARSGLAERALQALALGARARQRLLALFELHARRREAADMGMAWYGAHCAYRVTSMCVRIRIRHCTLHTRHCSSRTPFSRCSSSCCSARVVSACFARSARSSFCTCFADSSARASCAAAAARVVRHSVTDTLDTSVIVMVRLTAANTQLSTVQ